MESQNCRVVVRSPYADRNTSQKIQDRFILVYELEGCQEAVDFLTEFYPTKLMKIILNDIKVGNGDLGCYSENKSYFIKRGLNRRIILDKLCHQLVYVKGLKMTNKIEEEKANQYPRELMTKMQNHILKGLKEYREMIEKRLTN